MNANNPWTPWRTDLMSLTMRKQTYNLERQNKTWSLDTAIDNLKTAWGTNYLGFCFSEGVCLISILNYINIASLGKRAWINPKRQNPKHNFDSHVKFLFNSHLMKTLLPYFFLSTMWLLVLHPKLICHKLQWWSCLIIIINNNNFSRLAVSQKFRSILATS